MRIAVLGNPNSLSYSSNGESQNNGLFLDFCKFGLYYSYLLYCRYYLCTYECTNTFDRVVLVIESVNVKRTLNSTAQPYTPYEYVSARTPHTYMYHEYILGLYVP